MVRNVSARGLDFSQLERSLKQSSASEGAASSEGVTSALGSAAGTSGVGTEGSFGDMLAKGIKEVNSTVKESDQASMDLASGKSSNIHETMISVTKAELGFNMLVQLRNKAIEAYQDVMRMQV
ncbi:MAG: flagellar hook-basal body complex protein FliE [Silvanigrellales bacterium]|jgi:flagellar hook-basal body complex protein FliE|nr:flagellar hook-basal body complex protein FliE [Silvanigrellales bacterium]